MCSLSQPLLALLCSESDICSLSKRMPMFFPFSGVLPEQFERRHNISKLCSPSVLPPALLNSTNIWFGGSHSLPSQRCNICNLLKPLIFPQTNSMTTFGNNLWRLEKMGDPGNSRPERDTSHVARNNNLNEERGRSMYADKEIRIR